MLYCAAQKRKSSKKLNHPQKRSYNNNNNSSSQSKRSQKELNVIRNSTKPQGKTRTQCEKNYDDEMVVARAVFDCK